MLLVCDELDETGFAFVTSFIAVRVRLYRNICFVLISHFGIIYFFYISNGKVLGRPLKENTMP